MRRMGSANQANISKLIARRKFNQKMIRINPIRQSNVNQEEIRRLVQYIQHK